MTNFLGLVPNVDLMSLKERIDFSQLYGKKILITGASVMLGSYLVATILAACDTDKSNRPNLTLLVRDKNAKNLEFLKDVENVSMEECDLLTWVPRSSYDFLIHAASPASPTKYGNPQEIFDANVGFFHQLDKYGYPHATLFVSSGEVYGSNAGFL